MKLTRVLAYRCAERLATIAAAAILAQAVQAQSPSTLAGTYCLTGVMEVGSCIELSADGRFQYFLAYGAYDEKSEGIWRLANGAIILDSPAYDKAATFTFKRMRAGTGNDFDVVVESKAGRPIAGIDVRITCDGSTKDAGVTQADGFAIDCISPPTSIELGLRMFGVAPRTIDVAGRAGTERVYVFEFDPGDLGRKRFSAHRLETSEPDVLSTRYINTPITELQDRIFRYVRAR